jgi:tetratricopeptide (TPR) repeat protein
MRTTIWLATMLFGPAVLIMAAADQFDFNSRNSTSFPITGKVNSTDKLELSLLRVQLVDQASRRVLVDTPLGLNGDFQLPPLATGFYEFRVVGQADEVRYRQDIHAGTTQSLNVFLPSRQPRNAGNAVSALRLMHETPKKAAKEMEAASKALRKQERPKAIEHLEKAAALDPENFDVASNLGALYMQENQPQGALAHLKRAYKIDPSDTVNNVNLSAYYANEGDFQKAEEYAVAGLKTDPNSVRGRYMLAVSLVRQGKDVNNARTQLNQIQNVFAPARNLLMTLTPRQ